MLQVQEHRRPRLVWRGDSWPTCLLTAAVARHHAPARLQSAKFVAVQDSIGKLQADHDAWRAAIAGLERDAAAKQAEMQALPKAPDHIAEIMRLDAEANQLYQQVRGPGRGGAGWGGVGGHVVAARRTPGRARARVLQGGTGAAFAGGDDPPPLSPASPALRAT